MKICGFLSLVILLLWSCASDQATGLDKCKEGVRRIVESAEFQFNPDSYSVEYRTLKEESYFEELSVLVLKVVNASTTSLDFKSLPDNVYKRFNDFSRVEQDLKEEAAPMAKMVLSECELDEIDEIIIEFVKYGESSSEPMYRFICHYPLSELRRN